MKQLYEANASAILSKNMHNPQFKTACEALLKKGYDISRISDSAIKKMSPADAFKLKGKQGDKYFKFWFDKTNKFAFCTWANTMIDINFRWKRGERTYPIGSYRWVDAYMKSNDAINELGYAYVIAFDDMPKNEELKKQRTDARAGATALMSDDQIRKMNFARYQEILMKNNFSDGFEFSFIENAIKPIKLKAFNRYSPFMTLYKWDGGIYDSIIRYLDDLKCIINIIQKYEYNLAKVPKDYSYYIDSIKKDFMNIQEKCNTMFEGSYYRNVLEYYRLFEKTDRYKLYQFKGEVLELVGNNDELGDYISRYYTPMLFDVLDLVKNVNDSLLVAINKLSNTSNLTIAKIEIFNDICNKIGYILYDETHLPDKLDLYYLWSKKQLKVTDIKPANSVIRLMDNNKLEKIPTYCKMLKAISM